MAACELSIEFDKRDRRYYTDGPVSGKVVVKVNKDYSGGDFRLYYFWRTHGFGNKDEGGKGSILLARDDLSFRNGEIRTFQFRFPAPCEPLSYHGHYVNVDWYLKATMVPQEFLKPAITAEEDFLLLDRNTPMDPMPAPPPVKAQNKPKIPALLRLLLPSMLLFLLLIFLMVFNYFSTPTNIFLELGIIFVLTIAWIAQRKIIDFVLQLFLGMKEAYVGPLTIQPGDQVSCRLQFQVISSIYLDQISVEVQAKERSLSGSGSRVDVEEYTIYSKQTVKSYGEELAARRWITFACSMPIPANAPLTFKASNNSINWSIVLKIVCKPWLSWEKVVPIIVVSRPG